MAGSRNQDEEEIRIFSSFFTILKVERDNNILTFKIPESEYSSKKIRATLQCHERKRVLFIYKWKRGDHFFQEGK